MEEKSKPGDPLLVWLAKQCVADGEEWFPEVASNVVHYTVALAGEVGEFANIVKKLDRGSLDISDAKVRYDITMELTDVFIYVLNLAGLLKFDLEQAYMIKRAENVKRFGKEHK